MFPARSAAVAAGLMLLAVAQPASAQTRLDDGGRCADLQRSPPAGMRIVRAAVEPPGTGWAKDAGASLPGKPQAVKAAFCRVQAVIDKEIGVELWLPLRDGWNGKLLGAGVGGDAGLFNFQDLPRGVNRGYAAATTDSGHKAADATWMLGDPERLVNFQYRAHHLLAVAAKAVVAQYYGEGPRFSYFVGCSGGGRQGLKEVQMFPDDYDGVLAGASGPNTAASTTRRMWELLRRDSRPGLMSPADWKLIADAGVASCDALDGVKDGVAEDPRRCSLDISALRCAAGQAQGCLTAEQVEFAAGFYAPLRDEEGRKIDEGLLPGVLVDSGRSRLAPANFGQAVRRKADWDGKDFSVRDDYAAINRVMPELKADKADISAFRNSGGKLILYSGWMDPAVAARAVTDYRDAVTETLGADAADGFLRLYMAPGMFHCSGGPGADRFGGAGADGPAIDERHDLLSALEAWVEKGRAPRAVIASKIADEKVIRTRLLCPYPQQAKYDGVGDPDQATSYACGMIGQ